LHRYFIVVFETITSVLLIFNSICVYRTARKTGNCYFIEVYYKVLVNWKIRKDTSVTVLSC